jgi:hypothetical protein
VHEWTYRLAGGFMKIDDDLAREFDGLLDALHLRDD